jgi:hypothetical protein
MTQTITRLYASHDNALAAVKDLKELGLGDDSIHVVPPMPNATIDEIAAAIAKGRVWKSYAKIYAQKVKQGATLVSAHALFGMGMPVTLALQAHSPIASGIPEPEADLITWDEAAPLSSSLRMPVLARNPAPFSNWWGLPVLTRGRASLSAALGIPEVTSGRAFHGTFGMPLLSGNPSPLSSLFHLPTLTRR